jgi:hypothetical protein
LPIYRQRWGRFDANRDGIVTIDEILAATENALSDCPGS